VPDVDDGGVDIRAKQRLEGALYPLGIRRLEVLKCRIGRSVGMRIDEGIERVGDGDFRMAISRKSEFRKLPEFRGDARELVNFPRRCAVMVDQTDERLLLAATMAVERPCQNPCAPIMSAR
jgi:hypothetical protein